MVVKRSRGRSCPVKATSEPRVKCFFYHRVGRCIWGSFCRFQHDPPRKIYRERVNCFLSPPPPTTPEQLALPVPLALDCAQDFPPLAEAHRRLEDFRKEIRQSQIEAFKAEVRVALLRQMEERRKAPPRLVQGGLDGWIRRVRPVPPANQPPEHQQPGENADFGNVGQPCALQEHPPDP
jgi:hypothetical protein